MRRLDSTMNGTWYEQETIPFSAMKHRSFRMSNWDRIWRALVPVVLIVAILATTMGMLCHHHHDRYSADQCTLCHLVIAPTVANTDVEEPAPASADYAVQSMFFTARSVVGQIPSRAPPA